MRGKTDKRRCDIGIWFIIVLEKTNLVTLEEKREKKLIVVLMMIAMVMPYQAIKAEENDDNTIKITSIQLEQSFVALRYGETSKLGINMKPKKATYRDVKFKSMNDDTW